MCINIYQILFDLIRSDTKKKVSRSWCMLADCTERSIADSRYRFYRASADSQGHKTSRGYDPE